MGERSFSKSWGLRASVSFFPLPLPRHSFYLLSSHLFSTNSRGNASYAGYPAVKCSLRKADVSPRLTSLRETMLNATAKNHIN